MCSSDLVLGNLVGINISTALVSHTEFMIFGALIVWFLITRIQDEDVFVAIRDAFAAATRRIEDHARKLRGEVKAHDVPHHARVTKLFPA